MRFIIFSLLFIFNIQASDSGSDFKSEKSASGARSTAHTGIKASSVARRFKSTASARPTSMPVTTTPTKPSKPVKPKKRRKGVSINPKIYIKSSVPSLEINWLDGEGKTTDTIEVPKTVNTPIKVPTNIKYFDIRNNTETLKSNKLKITDKTIYTISCANFSKKKNCLKLQIESSKIVTKSNTTTASNTIIAPKISSHVKTISLINQTHGALEIAWLTSGGQLISKDKILTDEAKVYEIPNKAMKFTLIRGGGALISNTIVISVKGSYIAKCLPSNYYCKQISVEKD